MKVLIIGLDGADYKLTKRLMEQGKLPNLMRIRDKGVFGPIKSVPNMVSAPAWISFATGKNPGKHGVFHFSEFKENSYNKKLINRNSYSGITFWQILSQNRKKSILINIPITYPSKPFNGLMISGIDSPAIMSKGFTYPPSLIHEVINKIGSYIIIPDVSYYYRHGDYKRAVEVIYEAMMLRFKTACYLMDSYNWHLFIVVFNLPDIAQHFFWKFHDSNYYYFQNEKNDEYKDIINNIYIKLDEYVGELIKRAGKDVNSIVMSDHGGAPNHRGAAFLQHWLKREGLMVPRRGTIASSALAVFKKSYLFFDKRLTLGTKKKLENLFPQLKAWAKGQYNLPAIDFSLSKAFIDGPTDHIWINLKSKFPQGIVEDGQEYEELKEYICQNILLATDPLTGQKMVEHIFTKEEIYSGKYVEKAPDLLVRYRDGVTYSDEKVTKNETFADVVSGAHSLYGILLMSGNVIKKRHQARDKELIDLAPTILHLFDIQIPRDIDGKVMLDCIV